MPDVTPDVSQPRPQDASPAGASAEADPSLKLHKMSTTAGLGSGDYVAINGTAIAALLLGITSSLVLFGLMLLMLIPLAGIVCAVLAFRQISDSNGTQTGRGLAALGLLLSLGFGGVYVGKETVESVRNSGDETQITAIISQIESAVKAEKYEDIYALCGDQFKQRVPVKQFVDRWRAMNNSPVLGKITAIQSKLLKFETDPVTEERVSNGLVLFSFEKVPGQDRQGMIFRKVGDKWVIADLPSAFPAENPRGGPGGAPPGGAPPAQPAVVPSGPAGPPAPTN
jgi:hypothetical protein